jgi:hypothetical protein
MKNTNKLLITTLAGIALSLITVSAQTQVKGGERMLQLNSATTAAVTPGGYKHVVRKMQGRFDQRARHHSERRKCAYGSWSPDQNRRLAWVRRLRLGDGNNWRRQARNDRGHPQMHRWWI